MAGIFLSYRRSDAEGQAGRLYDDLAGHFGQNTVFMDVAGIEAGRDFRQAIDRHVTSCGVLLALIGKEWVSATDAKGQRRLDDPNDFVRLEVATALKRDIPVIPVLVRGAAMPQAAELPADCADLSYRNAVELTHARWGSDVQVLIKALTPYVDERPAAVAVVPPQTAPARSNPPPAEHAQQKSAGAKPWMIALPIVVAIAGGAMLAHRYYEADDNKPQAPQQPGDPPRTAANEREPTAQTTALPGLQPTDNVPVLVAPGAGGAPRDGGAKPLSDWMSGSQFQAYRQARPAGERFPYELEVRCVKKGENQVRARFAPQPPGVREIRIDHSLLRAGQQLPVVDGFREYSNAQCSMPNGGRLIVRVMVRP